MDYEEKVRFISENILTNIFVMVGRVFNVAAFLVWVFGPKSKVVCCASPPILSPIFFFLRYEMRDFGQITLYLRVYFLFLYFKHRSNYQPGYLPSLLLNAHNSVAICIAIANHEETICVCDFSDCSFATTHTIPNIICTQFYSTHLLLL